MTWRFSDFYVRFHQWVDDDDPSEEFRFWVIAWLFRLQDDPMVDAARAPGVGEPWWFAKIPGAEDDRLGVVCLYSIVDEHVRCSNITTLRKPII